MTRLNYFRRPREHALTSTALQSVLYDHGRLTITFISGREYVYEQVPAHVAKELQQADSAGRYFHYNIRGKYPTLKRLH